MLLIHDEIVDPANDTHGNKSHAVELFDEKFVGVHLKNGVL